MPSRKPGCVQCRRRHIRCDSAQPACGTCERAKDGRQCSYVGLEIRPSRYVQRIEEQKLDKTIPRPWSGRTSSIRPSSQPKWNCHRAPANKQRPTAICEAITSPKARDETTSSLNVPFASNSAVRSQGSGVVDDPSESELFEYYIKEAGYYLDIVSPQHHLSRAAPILALSDPLLYSACLAYASHVLYLLGRLDKVSEQKYNDKAIQLLIQKLSEDPSTWSEGSVLTTTVLMRVTEQFSEIADDGEYHLNGAFSVTASAGRTWDLEPVDLETSAFWTYLRMSVRMCFLCEHETKCDPVGLVRIPLSYTAAGPSAQAEAALTNRMTWLIAKICNVCWPSSGSINEQDLIDLQAELYGLEGALPSTFASWSSSSRAIGMHANVKFISTWHAIFWQFFHAAEVLLAANFALLAPSPTIAAQGQFLEREILSPTRKLLAIAFSNHEIGLRINAAALVGWCGQFLTITEEQNALIAWLSNLSRDAAWPSRTVTGRLQRIWAGEQSHWAQDPAT